MSTQIGAPIRIVAFVGLLLALAVGAWMFVAGRSTADPLSSGTTRLVEHNPVAAAQSVAKKLSAHNRATAAGKPDLVSPAKPSAPTHVGKAKPAAKGDTMPTTLESALRLHPVAVVLVYDPEVKIGQLSVTEAQLGAQRANVSFLRVNVLKESQAAPFAKRYGVLPVPTLLFFARPGTLVQTLSGFADRDTVAQAALIAVSEVRSTGPKLSASLGKWRDQACASGSTTAGITGRETPGQMKRKLGAVVTALVAIPLPTGAADRQQVRGFVALVKKLNRQIDKLVQVKARGNRAAMGARLAALQRDSRRAETFIERLGLSAC